MNKKSKKTVEKQLAQKENIIGAPYNLHHLRQWKRPTLKRIEDFAPPAPMEKTNIKTYCDCKNTTKTPLRHPCANLKINLGGAKSTPFNLKTLVCSTLSTLSTLHIEVVGSSIGGLYKGYKGII